MAKFAAKDSNKDITISPHGTGKIKLGTGAATATVESDGNHNISIRTGNSTTGQITIVDGADGNIEISPDNNGAVVVGSGSQTATVKSDGNHNLSLKTGNSTTGTITIVDGADGNIEISPDNNGNIVLGSGSQTATVKSDGNYNLSLKTGNSTTGTITIVDGADGNIEISPNNNGAVVVGSGSQDATVKSDGDHNLVLQTGNATTGSISITDGANGNIAITPNGTGEVDISKVDIDGGTIDGATIATSDITVGSGKTLDGTGTFDVQNGTFTTSTAQKDAIVDGSTAISRSGNNLTFAGTVATGAGITIPDGSTIGSASDTDAITIDPVGYVIRSAQPYFEYIGAGNDAESINNGNRAQFDVQVQERGSNYNTTSWFFLTPIAGVYTFNAQLYTYNTSGTLQQWSIYSQNTSDSDGQILTKARLLSPSIGDVLNMSWTGYVAAARRISVINDSGGARTIFMSASSHSKFSGALIG